jgi:peptidoglycan/xylan/chitin deacetylase (PgdA/CDA1 family)
VVIELGRTQGLKIKRTVRTIKRPNGLERMRLVSALLKRVVYPALYRAGYLGKRQLSGGWAVANYHGVIMPDASGDDAFLDGNLVSLGSLRRQLQFLKTNFNVVRPEELRAWIERGERLPERAILVTCDDGLLNSLVDMVPVLQSEDISCLFFVTGASCSDVPGMLWYEELYHLLRVASERGIDVQVPAGRDKPSLSAEGLRKRWWNAVVEASRLEREARADWMACLREQCGTEKMLHPERRWRLLNRRELRSLADLGMTVGAHTLTHPVLSQCSDEEAYREIGECKREIEREVGQSVWAFAYPFGTSSAVGDREMRLAREAGFSCAFLNVDNRNSQPADYYALSRTHVSAEMSTAEFAAHLTGFHTRLQRAVRG